MVAEDWASDVKKYVPGADDVVIAGIVRYCGIALRSRDASMVAFSEKTETDRVRENFLKKKLGLVDPDSVLDAAVAAVGDRMKADRTKNRVTVYYLLAEAFGKLPIFISAKAAKERAAGVAAPVAAAPATLVAVPEATPVSAAVAMPVVGPVAVMAAAPVVPRQVSAGGRSVGRVWEGLLPIGLLTLGGLGVYLLITQ